MQKDLTKLDKIQIQNSYIYRHVMFIVEYFLPGVALIVISVSFASPGHVWDGMTQPTYQDPPVYNANTEIVMSASSASSDQVVDIMTPTTNHGPNV